jgi:hypothetical protein
VRRSQGQPAGGQQNADHTHADEERNPGRGAMA